MRFGLLLALCALLACNKGDEISFAQFNATSDTVLVEVGAPEELPAVEGDLHSSTGEVVVGLVEVSPGGGPIGTVYDIVVVVDNENENDVDRVSVQARSPGRGADEYDLTQDSADEGYYKLRLVSVGEEGEQRSDELTVRLWSEKVTEESSSSEE